MRRSVVISLGVLLVLFSACAQEAPGTLQAASKALGAVELKSIEYAGTGKWFQFGQAPSPTLAWPAFDVTAFTASVNYETPAARVQMTRKQVVEPGRVRPAPVDQKVDQYISGSAAWNAPAAANGTPAPAPAAVEERRMEIWSTPHGFLKAAVANNATTSARTPTSEAITRPRRAKARRWGMRVLSGPVVRWPAARGAMSAGGRPRSG